MKFITIIKEIFEFLGERKKWWLVPLFLFLLVLGALIVFAAGSPVAPFIYTLF